MELKVDYPTLAGQSVDPDTFQRVWDRVMPDQAAPRSDTSIPDTAVPAVPTEPTEPAEPDLPPVPDCPALSPVPDCPTMSPVPDCPRESQCPACPEIPECPACPQCPGASGTPAFCLGEDSRGDSQRLEQLMTLAKEGAAAARLMACRASGSCAKALSALACDHRLAFRRLSAAYFLITGKRYSPKCGPVKLNCSLALALRRQFLWEQQWEQLNNQAAQATTDHCLKELYLELAQEGAFHAGSIRSLLEQMA